MPPHRQFPPGPAWSPERGRQRHRAAATPPHIAGAFRRPATIGSSLSSAAPSNLQDLPVPAADLDLAQVQRATPEVAWRGAEECTERPRGMGGVREAALGRERGDRSLPPCAKQFPEQLDPEMKHMPLE